MKKYLLTSIILVLIFNVAFSQAPKVKFGKVTEEELNMKYYEKDSSADAVVLFNKGEIRFNFESLKGFQYVYKEHLRIKIFNSNAFSYADHTIPFYHDANNKENLSSFKAFTYNLIDGKIEKNKLSIGDVMWKEYNSNRDDAIFTLPNVKEGSIIDIEYTIVSDYLYSLRNWQFQYDIPVVWSEFYTSIPEYYVYRTFYNGYYKLNTTRFSEIDESFIYEYKDDIKSAKVPGMAVGQRTYKDEAKVKCKEMFLASDNIPAFKKEPYMPTTKKYLFEIEFELASIQYPQQTHQDYAQSWESIQRKLMENDLFGRQLKKGFLSDEVDAIISNCTTENEKLMAIYGYIQNKFKWDGNYRIIPENPLKTVFQYKSGSSSDLNLLLVLMLKNAGINARPMLISTKNNGMVNKNRPGINEFNTIICHAIVGSTNYVLDVTDKYCYPNFLPLNCLNGEGRIIDVNYSDWYNLSPQFISKQTINGNYSINSDGEFIGKLQKSSNYYYAYSLRKELNNYESKEKFIEDYQAKNQNIKILDFDIQGTESSSDQLKESYTIQLDDQVEIVGDLFMFYPLNTLAEIENPFKSETRTFPIYFDFPYEKSYIMNYKIPEGYKVEFIPESIKIKTPDNSAFFTFVINQNGDYLQVVCKKGINEMLYPASDYKILKEFYYAMISKQNEKIVLKKII